MKVLVGLSGGVDSSVAAALLREQGHQVVGVTLKLWGGESDTGCCSVSDVEDARRAADRLDIDHHVFNFGAEFNEHVVEPYVAAHQQGLTPNPCAECNRHLKFDVLLARARALGFDAIATGHYAQVVDQPDGSRRISRGVDTSKDQSYVVAMLTQDQLAHTLFPLGGLHKTKEVRALAAKLNLPTAAKPDSQDVCFIQRSKGRESFLADRMAFTAGVVRDTSGKVLGEVPAVQLVTIGQRRGVGLPGGHEPRYVVDVDVAQATVTVGSLGDLHQPTTALGSLQWANGCRQEAEGTWRAQASAHGVAVPVTL